MTTTHHRTWIIIQDCDAGGLDAELVTLPGSLGSFSLEDWLMTLAVSTEAGTPAYFMGEEHDVPAQTTGPNAQGSWSNTQELGWCGYEEEVPLAYLERFRVTQAGEILTVPGYLSEAWAVPVDLTPESARPFVVEYLRLRVHTKGELTWSIF